MNREKKYWNAAGGIIAAGTLFVFFILAASAQEPKLFQMEDLSGALVLLYERTHESESYKGDVLRDITRNYLEGGIQLDTTGSIYHPNFLSFEVDVNILAHRTKSILFSDTSINNDVNNTYDIRLTFLKKKKLNFRVYAIRNYFSFDRAFYERYFTVFKNFGAGVNSKTKLFPFSLDFYVNRTKSESLYFPERDERSKNLDFKMDLLNVKKTNSRLTFKLRDYSEVVYDIDFQSMNLMANVQHYFNSKRSGGSDALLSVLNFRRLSGDSDFSAFNLYNTARYHLKRNLDIRGEYRLIKDESFNRSTSRHDISTQLHHKLYESLDTILMVGARFEDSNYQEINGLRYGINLNYRKKIPLGVFRMAYANRRENADYRSKGAVDNTSYLLDFSFADTVVITMVGIDVDSIVVTDSDYMYIYVPGVDYHVTVLDNVVTITRLPGGAIPPETAVLVHFEFMSAPNFKLKLNTSRLEAQLQLLKRFHFYYRRGSNNPVTVSDYTVFPFEDYKKTVIGGKFNSNFLRAEYYREKYDSSRSNYISHNYRLAVNIQLSRFFRLSGDVVVNRLNYNPEVFFSHLDAYTAECSVFPSSRLILKGIYRKFNYSIPGIVREQESVIAKLHWTIRRIIVEFFYERIFSGALYTERSRDYLSLIIRRTF
jgi:hypothetical protein